MNYMDLITLAWGGVLMSIVLSSGGHFGANKVKGKQMIALVRWRNNKSRRAGAAPDFQFGRRRNPKQMLRT
jgi:hypothetical protein